MNKVSGTLSDEQLEKKVQEKGLNAPRITPHDIQMAIDVHSGVQFHRFPGTTVTVCCVPMMNGYQVVGKSAAVSLENFDEEIGKEVALKDAKNQMWALLGYALRERMVVEHHNMSNLNAR